MLARPFILSWYLKKTGILFPIGSRGCPAADIKIGGIYLSNAGYTRV